MGPFAFRLFGPSRSERDADRLYATILEIARRPGFYGAGRAPDTFDGRFELVVAVAAVAMMRLKAEPRAERLAQDFADRFFLGLDDSLREVGVGDLSVPKQMKALAKRVYGRWQAYSDVLAPGADDAAISAALARNVWPQPDEPFAGPLGQWLALAWDIVAAEPIERLADAALWPAPPR
jgi:cytochrome b pre-mRNA-processing protein 3